MARYALYDRVQPRIRWELRESVASRTMAKVPVRRVFFHRGALLPRGGPLSRRLPGPRVAVRTVPREEAGELLETARVAVTLRYREVHGFNFADPGDVVVADAGRGVDIAWFGLLPVHRLPLRAHYGYLLLKNGVPVGYGDASLLFDWCEVAFNIFETFRQGESAFILVRLLAFLYQWLHVRAFRLSPFQIGSFLNKQELGDSCPAPTPRCSGRSRRTGDGDDLLPSRPLWEAVVAVAEPVGAEPVTPSSFAR